MEFVEEVLKIIKNYGRIDVAGLIKATGKDERAVRDALYELFQSNRIVRKDVLSNGAYAHFYYSIPNNTRVRVKRESKTEPAAPPKKKKSVKPVRRKLQIDGTFREYTKEDDERLEAALRKIAKLN